MLNDARSVARRGSLRWFLAFLAVVAGIAGFELYSLVAHQHERASTPAAVATPTPAPLPAKTAAGPVGAIDAPAGEAVVGPRVTISGWALDADGIKSVEVRVDGRVFAARTGIARSDLHQARPELPADANGGFEFTGDFSTYPAPAGVDRRTLEIVAVARDGRETVLGRRSLIDPAALVRWAAFTPKHPQPFHLLPALSGIDLGGASELDTIYAPYLSATMKTGFRVPILYLRMTRGQEHDYAFDPDWDPKRRCGERRIGDDSLNTVLAHSIAKRLPVLTTLNGGIWADAYCDVPQWDVNDRLEQDIANCQWNQSNEVMPDGYLKDLPGSQEAPELARSLTFNVYASDVRRYKKRNLQQAGARLAAFAREHPDLFIGINLDPDTYLNPFFSERQWYDYNPGTLRQFREWLAGSGPYAGRPARGVPDLRKYRRSQPLTLSEVNRIAGASWRSWRDVDPPRAFPRDKTKGAHAFWEDPWVREWEIFRRHLVHLHYDELAQWLVEAGISPSRIWSSQGLMAPHGDAMPFAIEIDSAPRNYDSGGMSIAGAKPAQGHLGVILYGEAAVNDVPMDNGKSLFATLAAIDPHWAVVEYNTADLRNPAVQPTYQAAYRGWRDLWNFGARYVSPMAWNGSNGLFAGKPGYSTFTAWRNTPLEDAALDFLLARAGLPLGALLWTFGTRSHADDDGWSGDVGALALGRGYLTLSPDANGRVALHSATRLPSTVREAEEFVIGLAADSGLKRVRVQARRGADGGWETLADAPATALRTTAAGFAVSRSAGPRSNAYDQIRIELTFAANTPRRLHRIAVL
ncbi:MAG: hypothetical protein IT521_15655 [Burkholderiales bacterium]|nr:hypothetical protein [Burkholderiales bacterium]